MKSFFTLLPVLLFISNNNTFAQSGEVDSTFGKYGIAGYYLSTGIGTCEALQSDGKIVVAGYDSTNRFLTVRFTTSGEIDSTFGINGEVSTLAGQGGDAANSIVIQNDGRILVGGYSLNNGIYQFALVRYNADGSPDTSFNGTGLTTISVNSSSGSDFGKSLALQTDGKIIMAGNSGANFEIIRLNPDGSLDSTFGSGGKVITYACCYDEVSTVVTQPDGKILLGGTASAPGGPGGSAPANFELERYNSGGTLDSSFGVNGWAGVYFDPSGAGDGEFSICSAIALLPDGKILLTGSFSEYNNYYPTIPIMRFNPNGSIDTSFGNGGEVAIINVSNAASSLLLQPDGKILIAGGGAEGYPDGAPSCFLIRCDSNGNFDSTFGNNGMVFTFLDSVSNGYYSLALQKDGKILAAGFSHTYGITVVRYLSGLSLGILDLSSPNNTLLVYPNPVQTEALLQYTLTANEHLTISLYDVQGRLVQLFINDELRMAGQQTEKLNFSPDLANGSYILTISNGKNNMTVKIIKD